jgi:hypothetical protein
VAQSEGPEFESQYSQKKKVELLGQKVHKFKGFVTLEDIFPQSSFLKSPVNDH